MLFPFFFSFSFVSSQWSPLESGSSWIPEPFKVWIFWISFILLFLSSSFCLSSPLSLDVLIKAESKIKLYHILTLANHSPKLYSSKHIGCFSSFYKGHIIKCFATACKRSSFQLILVSSWSPFWPPACKKMWKCYLLCCVLLFATPMKCSPPDFSVHGFLQARTLEWFAIFSSRVSSWLRNWTQVSCIAGGFFTIWNTRSDH